MADRIGSSLGSTCHQAVSTILPASRAPFTSEALAKLCAPSFNTKKCPEPCTADAIAAGESIAHRGMVESVPYGSAAFQENQLGEFAVHPHGLGESSPSHCSLTRNNTSYTTMLHPLQILLGPFRRVVSSFCACCAFWATGLENKDEEGAWPPCKQMQDAEF